MMRFATQLEAPLENVNLISDVFIHFHLELTPDGFGNTIANLTLTPDALSPTPGAPFSVFTDFSIFGADLYDYRVEFAGRTGGLDLSVDLDNILVQTMIPEPTTAALAGFGLLGLLGRRRRSL